MKIIVIYKSKTGFTQMYAQWISEALNCDMVSLDKVSSQQLESYDIIIYGAGIMAGKMYDLQHFKKIISPRQKIYIFATGAIDAQAVTIISQLRQGTLEQLERDVPFYYYQAGLCYEKMNFFFRKMLKMMYQSLKQKKEKTEVEEEMMKGLACSHIDAKQEDIQELIDDIKQGLL